MNTQIYTSLSPELRTEWEHLWETRRDLATAFNAPAWLDAAVETFGYPDVKIIAIHDNDGALKAVAALTLQKLYGLQVYAAPALEFTDKPPVLIDWVEHETVTRLVHAFQSIGTVYIAECSEIATRAMKSVNPGMITFQDDQNAIVDLSVHMYGDLSSSSQNKIKNRIAKSEHPVSMQHSGESHTETLKSAYEIEMISKRNERAKSVFQRPEVRAFYEALANRKPELLHVSVMDIGDKPVAYSVDFLAHGIYQGSQKAYVKGYEYFQPGKYLILKLIEYYHSIGHRAFDFGRGYDNFKLQFTKDVRPIYTIIIGNRAASTYISTMRTVRQKAYNTLVNQRALYKTFKSVRNALHI